MKATSQVNHHSCPDPGLNLEVQHPINCQFEIENSCYSQAGYSNPLQLLLLRSTFSCSERHQLVHTGAEWTSAYD